MFDNGYNEVELDEWGNPMAISVPCRIAKGRDEPIMIRGQIPYFEGKDSYRPAYQLLQELGYSTDSDSGKELGIVIQCGLQVAVEQFGNRLIPYSSLQS